MTKVIIATFFLFVTCLIADDINPIFVNPDGQVGLNVEESEPIPSGVDILLKGRTKSEGVFQLPVAPSNPADPKDGMIYIHTSGEVRYFVGGSWYKLSSEALPAPLLVESGVVSCQNSFQTIQLMENFISPVVIATPVSNINNAPVVVRIDQVNSSSFDMKLQRIDGLSDPLPSSLVVHYVVLEEGVYNLTEHGVKMEVVKFLSTNTDKNNSWNGQPLATSQTYENPVVLGQVMSFNNPDFTQFWCSGSSSLNPPSTGLLNVGKHTFQATLNITEPETLGVVIIESGSGNINGLNYHCGVGADIVLGVGNNGNYNYNLPVSINTGVVSQVAMDGGDGGIATFKVNPEGQSVLKLLVDEDAVYDSERKHTSEQVSFLVFE
jgi:hypothetical protein